MRRERNGEVLVEVLDRHSVTLPTSVRLSKTVCKVTHRETETLTFGNCFQILDKERLGVFELVP